MTVRYLFEPPFEIQVEELLRKQTTNFQYFQTEKQGEAAEDYGLKRRNRDMGGEGASIEVIPMKPY